MATDIIARGMASKAAKAAQEALNELSMVLEGTMNAAETEFTDLEGHVVTPDLETVYQDVNTYVYYRWNGTSYYTVSDPRNTLKYTPQTLNSSEKAQARQNIGAQEQLVSGENIKTVNGVNLLGSGDLVIKTYQPFNPVWPTSGTTKAFCDAVNADAGASVALAYLGEVTFTDLPSGMVNAEVKVEIMQGTGTADKVIHLELTSGNRPPYRWEYTYWGNGQNVSGWIPFQAAPQDLTASAVCSIEHNEWSVLKNVKYLNKEVVISNFNNYYDFIRVKISIDLVDYTVLLSKNAIDSYVGDFDIETEDYTYTIHISFNGANRFIFKLDAYEHILDNVLYDDSGAPLFDREDYVLQTLEGVDLLVSTDGHVLFDTNDSLLTASLEGGDNV